ncbi:MAG: ecotin precursor [Janthinobacterium lividum]
MKKIAMVLMLAGGIAAAGQASAQGWHGGGGYYRGGGGYYGGGGGYAGAAVVGAVAGLLIGSAVASAPRQQVVYAQPVYAQPVYAAPPQYCYDAYGRGYACAPPVPVYGPQPGW